MNFELIEAEKGNYPKSADVPGARAVPLWISPLCDA